MSAILKSIEWDTAACRYAQDDGTDTYVGLRLYAEIDGVDRRFFLRTSEHMYPGNGAMLELLQQLRVKGEVE